MAALEKKLSDIEFSHSDKVEKGLLKNLLIGYVVATNATDKSQILKLISSVLDFNQAESDKVGLNKSHVSWLTSIVNVAAGNNNNPSGSSSSGIYPIQLLKSVVIANKIYIFLMSKISQLQ